jgi:hypothetical protein
MQRRKGSYQLLFFESLMKALVFVVLAILLALVFPIIYGMTGNALFLLGLIPTFPAVFYLQYQAIQTIRHEDSKTKQDVRPDVSATRQWVEEMMNKNLANVLHVNGTTHKQINDRLARLERLSRQGGYLAFYYPKSVHELGFKEFCGTLHIGENGETYCLYDIKVNGKDLVSATIVPSEHGGYKANSEANYDHVCSMYSGRGTELCDELNITKEVAESLIAAYKEANP